MSVWKKLNSQDAFVTSYVAKKQWRASANQVEGLGVKFLPANKTFKERDCAFKAVAGILELTATVKNCSFELEAI